jgi:hypothetical protein
LPEAEFNRERNNFMSIESLKIEKEEKHEIMRVPEIEIKSEKGFFCFRL